MCRATYVGTGGSHLTAVLRDNLQPLTRLRNPAQVLFFTSLYDSGGQAAVDVLSVDVKSSVEFITSLLALPVQVVQQLS